MKDEIIIDVKEVGHRVFKKWKLLILAAVMGAVLMSMVGYASAYRDYKSKQPVDETTLETYRSKLSEKELEAAEQAFDTYEVYTNQYQSELEYSKNSILMKLGTDNVATVEMQYYIDNHYKSVYPVIEQTNNVTDIIEAYSLQLSSGDVMDQIKETTGTEIEGRYLRELISVQAVEESQTMKITISTDSKELTDGIADVIEREIDSFTQTIQEQYGEFDIVGTNRCESADIDDEVFELQQKEIASVTTLSTQLDSIGNNLNDAQLVYYNALINNATSSKESFEANIISKKNVVIGCVLGIAFACCCVFIKYFSQKTLRNQNDLNAIYHSYTFGIIKELKQEINPIVNQIKAAVLREKMSKIVLTSTDVSMETNNTLKLLASKIQDENLKVFTVCGNEKISNFLKENIDVNQVILVEKKNGSTYEDIEREVELLEICEINILGNIIINEE